MQTESMKMDEKLPKVSIIVPVYNAEKYLDMCLESICRQTYSNIEILLMVGMCGDNSLEKCIDWQKRDDRIIVVSRKEYRLGNARNCAVRIAEGKYLAYVDADDCIDERYIEKLLRPLEADASITMTCCGFDKFDGDLFLEGWAPEIDVLADVTFEAYLNAINWGMVWLKMYRKDWILENQLEMFDDYHEDDSFHICLAATMQKVYFVQEILYHYNIGNVNSIMHSSKHIETFIPALRFAIEYLQSHDLYEKNKKKLQNHVTVFIETVLRRSAQEQREHLLETANGLWKDYFTDVAEEMELQKRTKRHDLNSGVVLFGAGEDSKWPIEVIGADNIKYIVDNNPMRQGQKIKGLNIVPFFRLLEEKDAPLVLISSSRYYFDIAKQLRNSNIFNYMFVLEYLAYRLFQNCIHEKRIILLNTPGHTNLGDHAIAECEKAFFSKQFPDYDIIEISEYHYQKLNSFLPKYVRVDDLLVITGGGFLGSLWMEFGEKVVRNIIGTYPHNRIVIMPQTMWFEDSEEGERQKNTSRRIYGEADDLLLLLRENHSYELAKTIFSDKIRCAVVPDIALSLSGYDTPVRERQTGGLCLRDDKESVLTPQDQERISRALATHVEKICTVSMRTDFSFKREERQGIIEGKIRELKSCRVVVTDALHCMIFCAVSGTPCVVLDNVSKKLSGVYEWIKELPYIAFAATVDDVDAALRKVLQTTAREYSFQYEPYAKKILDLIVGRGEIKV